MIFEAERRRIVAAGRELLRSGLTTGTGGNLSICLRDKGVFAISPSGIPYDEIRPEDVVILNMDGAVIDGDKKPSSEVELHRIFYTRRTDLNAMVHTHSRFATTIASLRWDLPAVHYMIAVAGVDVRCAEYATFGTPELAENAFRAMKDRRAVLLANHGLLCGGVDMSDVFNVAEEVEYVAELYYRSMSIGKPVILPEDEMKLMLEKFKTYGQPKEKK